MVLLRFGSYRMHETYRAPKYWHVTSSAQVTDSVRPSNDLRRVNTAAVYGPISCRRLTWNNVNDTPGANQPCQGSTTGSAMKEAPVGEWYTRWVVLR
jgi:hypothetical protein